MTKIKLRALIVGVKNRCRKTDKHYLDIGYLEMTDDKAAWREIAKERCRDKMSKIDRLVLYYDIVTIDGDIETWRPFDERNIREVIQ